MSDSYGPQLPTAADVEAADAEASARWAGFLALDDHPDQSTRAEWLREIDDRRDAHADARRGAETARYLNWIREADAPASEREAGQ